MEKVAFELTWQTIFKIGILVVCLAAAYQLREVFILVLFAVVISLLFDAPISFLQKKKISRALATTLTYFLFFSFLAVLIYLFAPLLIVETSHFSQISSQYIEKISPPLRGLGIAGFENIENFIDLFEKNLAQLATNVISVLFSIFGGFLTTVFVIFLAFFFSLEQGVVERVLTLFFPSDSEDIIIDLWKRCQKRVSGWFLSRVIGSVFVGALTYICLLVLQSDYSFSFGLLAAISNFVPILGPVVAGVLIFAILALTSPVKAVFAIIVFVLVQQIENNILTPVLSK
ncbi:MAG: AI-2E family transporter, partial [bacterium]|nr:AI-2E family transporter [bacterium]